MTKTKKVAAIAVTVVLAGTMAVSLAACGNKDKNKADENKVVNMGLASGATLGVAIGYNSNKTGLFYGTDVGANQTFAGGYQANTGDAKPATYAIQKALNITLDDHYGDKSTSANLGDLVDKAQWGSIVDMATSDLSVAATQAANGSVLNLADYLDYMPNFKAFLEENPVVYLSILQGGMNTETGEGEGLYVAPYFDGMNDIEKGVLMRHDWIEAVLDNTWTGSTSATDTAADDTFRSACYVNLDTTAEVQVAEATGTSATSYMGTTGNWTILSTAEPESETGSDGTETVTIKKDYSAALTAIKDNSSALYTAYNTIDDTGYSGTSGNIVDIMNAAINANLDVTGEQLSALYKGYISAAYTNTSTNQAYYGTDSVPYSKVFTGYSACWDVDDLVALLRIIKCSSGQVGLAAGQKTEGLFPRDYTNSRTPDIISFVGELYGCRGATSRYENTYIDGNGDLQDARNDVKFWDALTAFGGLAQEGLVYSDYAKNKAYNTAATTYLDDMHGNTEKQGVGFMQWDYSQTQTTHEFDDEGINYGWVNTPVSLWEDGSTNDSGYSYKSTTKTSTSYNGGSTTSSTSTVQEKYMRFTDSWRSTKTAGLVVAASVENDEQKLAAALSFVDYLYSNDGQITTTYAIQDSTQNGADGKTSDGTWYGTPETNGTVEDDTYGSYFNETYQYVIKNEYKNDYVVYNGMICDRKGNPATLDITDSEGNVTETVDISGELDEYAEKVSSYSVKEEYQSKYFAFDGQLYSGTLYKGKMTPTITDDLYAHFLADSSSGYDEYTVFKGDTRGNFTNYARYVLGSTLPICVKDQSFENQMTATIAKNDATRVSVSIGNGTIQHCELELTSNPFYTCVPTGFPLTTSYQRSLDSSTQDVLTWETGTAYDTGNFWSMYHYIIWYGWEGSYTLNNCNVNLSNIGNSVNMIGHLNGIGLQDRLAILQIGWNTAKDYWAYLSK